LDINANALDLLNNFNPKPFADMGVKNFIFRNKTIYMLGLLSIITGFEPQQETHYKTDNYDQFPYYEGNDLEMTYSQEGTFFRVWAPTAEQVQVRIYKDYDDKECLMAVNMEQDVGGTWKKYVEGDFHHRYYTFRIQYQGDWLDETPGIYVKATGVNGKRGFICNPSEANPEGWQDDKGPILTSSVDAVIYELHLRDISIHPNSGIKNRGKYLGLIEKGTKNIWGQSTGLDHLKELGITHVHLLPVADFLSIDESKTNSRQYNWGYDPQNYNVPEGSYATNPYDPLNRIGELKQMVKALHEAGIGVIMDVVYNHTGEIQKSNFNLIVPGYYYRHTAKGEWSNASGCGNETASERPMMRRFIVESVKYWASEYHIDGFRFDLMGIHDIETMNLVKQTLYEINPNIIIYGEGWTAGDSPFPAERRALKTNIAQMPRIAVFSDELRDGVKGPWYNSTESGFIGGVTGLEESIKFGIVAATKHPQIDYQKVNYSKAPYAAQPDQCINYVSCHDNHTLWDKIRLTVKNASEEELVKMNMTASAIVLTSQGIPFLHNGVEMMRSKKGVENSFNSPDSINQIDWNWKYLYSRAVKFHQQLIELRKQHPAFRMKTSNEISENLHFLSIPKPCIIAYTLNGKAVGDSWRKILVIFNGNRHPENITIPDEHWKIIVNGDRFLSSPVPYTEKGPLTIPASSVIILAVTE